MSQSGAEVSTENKKNESTGCSCKFGGVCKCGDNCQCPEPADEVSGCCKPNKRLIESKSKPEMICECGDNCQCGATEKCRCKFGGVCKCGDNCQCPEPGDEATGSSKPNLSSDSGCE